MSQKQTKEVILELIRFVDRNRSDMFKLLDPFGGYMIFPIVALLYVFAIIWFFLMFSTTDIVYKIAIAISFLAFTMGFLSLFARFLEENEINVNFKRFKKCVEEDEKPLLKALIKIKAKNREFSLEQIYGMYEGMFTKEKLLEKLYE